jgi:LysM repeat protein
VQSPRWLIVTLSVALFAALTAFVACGGGGSDDDDSANDSGVIPTATLPASLPEPVILGAGQAPAGSGSTYTVQDGDTFSSIAAQFGITAEELMAANNITDPLSLIVGQELTIPGTSAPPQASNPTAVPVEPAPTELPAQEPPDTTGEQTYTVQEGDFPESIAAQFGITAEELMAANGITDPTSLHVGDVLIIPAPSGG